MEQSAIERAAAYFGAARRSGRVVERPPADLAPGSEGEAYAIQAALHRWFAANGEGDQLGHKIGCTTAVQQQYLNIARPCGGGMLRANAFHGGATIPLAELRRPGVECELAVRLGADVPPGAAPFDRHRIAAYVSEVMAAVEVVEDRYRDWRTWPAPLLIADDFFNWGCVLGEPQPATHVDLATMQGATLIDETVRGTGVGGDVMGHPYTALAWLANILAEAGRGLRRDEVVLMGSLVQTQWIEAPCQVVCRYGDPLGELRLRFV